MEHIPSFSAFENTLYGSLESEKPSPQEITLDELVKSIQQRCLSKIAAKNFVDCDNVLSWNEIATECMLELNSLSQEIVPYQNKWIRRWDDALVDLKDLPLKKQIKSCLGHFTYFQQLPLMTAIKLLSEKPPSYGRSFFAIGLISSASKSKLQKISCIKKISDLLCLWEDSTNLPTAANQPFLNEQNPAIHAILLIGLKAILTHPFALDTLWEAPLAGDPKEVASKYLRPYFHTTNKLISIAKKHLKHKKLMKIYYKLNENWMEAINAMKCKLRNFKQKSNEKNGDFCKEAIRKTERSPSEQLQIKIHYGASKQLLAVVLEMPALFTPENCS